MIDHNDKQLFQLATQGVKRLRYEGLKPDQINKKKASSLTALDRPLSTRAHQAPYVDESCFSDPIANPYSIDRTYIAMVDPDAALSFQQTGVASKQMKKLKKGDLWIEAALDLHGYTLEQAADALNNFLTRVQSEGKRCVRIIHGKGRRPLVNSKSSHSVTQKSPIIKSAVNQWLRCDHRVLAFSSAQPRDGGRGALYLLLKAERLER